jgi:hypothetical protein
MGEVLADALGKGWERGKGVNQSMLHNSSDLDSSIGGWAQFLKRLSQSHLAGYPSLREQGAGRRITCGGLFWDEDRDARGGAGGGGLGRGGCSPFAWTEGSRAVGPGERLAWG